MAKISDICLVIEGSYPYVTGGVSSWIQWLMENLSDTTFSVVALIAEPRRASERKYRLPPNVVSYEEFVIFDYTDIETENALRISDHQWQMLGRQLHRLMDDWREGNLSAESLRLIKDIITNKRPGIFKNFMTDENAFAVMTQIYEKFRGDAGFVKYFYNYRNIHLILFRLMTLVPKLPKAAVYHSPGTGYGGLLACLRAAIYGGRTMITEHGIYLQEREMELLKSEWLDDPYLKDMWIECFSSICRWQYAFSNRIITLYEGNKQLEIEYGAQPERIAVIPNGIAIDKFGAARNSRCTGQMKTIGIVGRVDSVKDIKTFIQAVAMMKKSIPELSALVIGPRKDQPAYFRECQQLVGMLGLEETITFTGRANVLDYYKDLDLLVLSSIKEAMPLVVMEAMASGIPVVATDVGACRELVYGLDDDIGPAGIVTRIMDAEGIAEAAVKICSDPKTANLYAANGIKRMERFYREGRVIGEYRKVYREEIADSQASQASIGDDRKDHGKEAVHGRL